MYFVTICTAFLLLTAEMPVEQIVQPKLEQAVVADTKMRPATGGFVITYEGNIYFHHFTSSGYFIPPKGLIFMIAGGSGGLNFSGGAGGTSMQVVTRVTAPIKIVIGDGGAGLIDTSGESYGFPGTSTSVGALTVTGGQPPYYAGRLVSYNAKYVGGRYGCGDWAVGGSGGAGAGGSGSQSCTPIVDHRPDATNGGTGVRTWADFMVHLYGCGGAARSVYGGTQLALGTTCESGGGYLGTSQEQLNAADNMGGGGAAGDYEGTIVSGHGGSGLVIIGYVNE